MLLGERRDMDEVSPMLTLRDVADLAGVQRAVVSMWRRRPRTRVGYFPFPEAVESAGSVERFRRDQIVDWLARTGRGKNAEHRLDAPALSVPAGATLEDLVTLLCLHSMSDGDLTDLSSDRLRHLAELIDPGDAFLLREVRGWAFDTDVLRFVDDLVEASFGLPQALACLENGAAGRALARRELTPEAIALLAEVASSCVLHLDPEGVPVVVHAGPTDFALAAAGHGRSLVVKGDGPAQRALRRRAVLREIDVAEDCNAPLIRVLSVLGTDLTAAFDAVDDLLLELGPREAAVLIGPARALCERLRGDEERFRAKLLRPGHLVAALRLPRGMWREAYRQALGVWVCAGSRKTDRPMVADLGAVPHSEWSVEDLAADVSGALASDGRRSFRYLHPANLPTILTGSPIVPQGARAPRWGTTGGRHLDRVQAAFLAATEPLEPVDVLVRAAPAKILLRRRSLGELLEDELVVIRRGSRINANDATPDGTIRVLSADDPTNGLALDPFDAERLYPRAQRTQPGDVVFVEGPPPRALVDEQGSSLVASPSRILRLHRTAGVLPHTLAAIINHQSSVPEWRSWSIPTLGADEATALEAALADAEMYAAALQRRQDALRDLTTALIDGVAAGAVSVVPRNTDQGGP